jgi:hypothetical protein
MTNALDKEQRQSLYDDEQSKIGKFSGLLSASCKFAWAGSLAIFFSSFVSSDNAALARFQSVFFILRWSAIFGALTFIAEIFQYLFAYIFASRYSKWLANAEVVTREDVETYGRSIFARLNVGLFYTKIIFAILSAVFLAIGTVLVSVQRMPI